MGLKDSTPDSVCPQFPPLERPDNVRFWTEEQWREYVKAVGGQPLSDGSKLKLVDFVEDADGVLITSDTRSSLNDILELCYNELLNRAHKPGGGVIKTWAADGNSSAFNLIAANVYPRFPEFRLCHADWKLQAYLVQHYPSWSKNRINELKLLKDKKLAELRAAGKPIPSSKPIEVRPLSYRLHYILINANWFVLAYP